MFEKTLRGVVHPEAKIVILRLGKVSYMDTSGETKLSQFVQTIKKHGGIILISDLQDQPRYLLKKTGLYDEIGERRFYEQTDDAINYALQEWSHLSKTEKLVNE